MITKYSVLEFHNLGSNWNRLIQKVGLQLNFPENNLQLNLLNSETTADLSNYVQNGEWDLVRDGYGKNNLKNFKEALVEKV